MLRLLIALSTLVALLSSSARAEYLDRALGSWAIGGSAYCKTPSKLYTLTTYRGNITWRTATGDVDIETIISGDDSEFQTVTLNSMHRSGGHARGTAWTYTDIGNGFMQVKVGNGKTFVLGRCW